MGRDVTVSEPLAELVRHPLGHPPVVHEHQGRPVLLHMPGDQVEDLGHLLGRGDRAELVVGQLQGQVKVAAVPGVHDRAPRRPVGVGAAVARADQQPGHGLDRPLGGRQPDPLQRLVLPRKVLEPLQGQRQVRAALVPGHGVDLVDDDGAGRGQHRAAPLGGHQQVQRLRGGDQEIRRLLQHRRALGGGGVPGPHRHPDRRRGQPEPGRGVGDLGQRPLQVQVDVDGQGLQRRHVDHLRARGGVGAGLVGPVDPVDAHQERRQRLPGAGRRRDQRMAAGRDLPPALGLRSRRPVREPPFEPGPDRRMERLKHLVTVTQATDRRARGGCGRVHANFVVTDRWLGCFAGQAVRV